jgi:hypothetical protein
MDARIDEDVPPWHHQKSMGVANSLKELARELGPTMSVHSVKRLVEAGAPVKTLRRARGRNGRRYFADVEQVREWIRERLSRRSR